MTERYAQKLFQFHNLVASAEHAENQFKNRGDHQIALAHLRSIIRQADILIEELANG